MEMQHTTSGTLLAPEGLTSAEAAERLQQYGSNAIVEAPTRSGIMLLGDIATFALAWDRVVPSSRPNRWIV